MSHPTSGAAAIMRQALVMVATGVTLAFNSLSQSLRVGGQTSADVSNAYPTFFTPANYAFAIWGAIYLLLSLFSIYQALPAQRQNPYLRTIAPLYLLSCVLNCTWITLFQYGQILFSVFVIVALLLTLIMIYLRLDIGRARVPIAERWLVQLPFSVYLGWLSVATIANVAVLGVVQGWGDLFGIAAPTWAALMLVVATVLGLILALTRRDGGFVLVLAWAFIAIINKQSGSPLITTTALIGVVVLLVALVGSILFNVRRSQPRMAGRA